MAFSHWQVKGRHHTRIGEKSGLPCFYVRCGQAFELAVKLRRRLRQPRQGLPDIFNRLSILPFENPCVLIRPHKCQQKLPVPNLGARGADP
jgi:hypothetical protein